MSDRIDDPEFWLPSEFLTDDDILADNQNINFTTNRSTAMNVQKPISANMCLLKYESSTSSLRSSPVDSTGSSTGTDTDEEDLLAELTRHLSLLEEHQAPQKKETMAGSPQSTLSQMGSWSTNGSPNGPSRVSSPQPSQTLNGPADAWDLLYYQTISSYYATMKMNGYEGPTRTAVPLGPPPLKPKPIQPPAASRNSTAAVYNIHGVSGDQKVKQQGNRGVWDRQVENGMFYDRQFNTLNRGPEAALGARMFDARRESQVLSGGLNESAWPALQARQRNQSQPQQSQHHRKGGSDIRAVFLGGSGTGVGVKKECAGTGVFLPRRYGSNNRSSSDSRKKSGGSTVIIPPKVVQALNKSFDSMGCYPQPRQLNNGDLVPDYDMLMARRNSLAVAAAQPQQRSLHLEGSATNELRLPQEWTY